MSGMRRIGSWARHELRHSLFGSVLRSRPRVLGVLRVFVVKWFSALLSRRTLRECKKNLKSGHYPLPAMVLTVQTAVVTYSIQQAIAEKAGSGVLGFPNLLCCLTRHQRFRFWTNPFFVILNWASAISPSRAIHAVTSCSYSTHLAEL